MKWDDEVALGWAYDQLQAGEPVAALPVREPVLASWRRCRSQGLAEKHKGDLPYHEDLEDARNLTEAAGPVLETLESRLSGTRTAVFLADERARLLDRRAGYTALYRRLDALQLAPGFSVPESVLGTNGIGTALVTRRPVFICGREHYGDYWADLACTGAPVRDPLSGQLVGALNLTSMRANADPAMLTMTLEAAHAVEQRLLAQASVRERDLLQAFRAARPAPDGGAEGPGTVVDEWLERNDRFVIEERATELISSGHTGLVEVRLAGGRTAILRSRPVTTPSGVNGIAVEAALPSGVRRRVAVLTDGGTPAVLTPRPTRRPGAPAPPRQPAARAGPPPPPPSGQPESRTDAEPGDSSRDTWLVAVGEPLIGTLALQARERLGLLHDASACVGTTLDVVRTAEELTKVVVPRFADFTAVDVPEAMPAGEEPVRVDGALRRVALMGVREDSPLSAAGDQIHYGPSTPQARCLTTESPVLEPERATTDARRHPGAARSEQALRAGAHSLIAVPMRARGALLGVVSFYRSERREPFTEDDLLLAEELVGRAALSIDNARRFTREHTVALALQRSLLPRGLPAQHAVEAAHRYLPARSGVGGDWFDVIPLSGARVALVVGDVVGHGLHAAATMGRLRTAVHNFSALDLAADEVLAHLDDLVARLDADQEPAGTGTDEIVGASCLYAVYDPVARRCTIARAGHPPPALVGPDGTVEYPDLPGGPPLGVGGYPFETAELEIPEGSQLVLYTDGLIEHLGHRDVGLGMDRLRDVLTGARGTPEQTCHQLDLLLSRLPADPADDVALLVARTRALGGDQVATWELAADPAEVPRVRAEVTAQLDRWGLDDLLFSTELTVSELLTNALRHGSEPISLRLLRDRTLICEVADGSSTSPHLRRAADTDEGGRGLFLVAQLVQRWGTRYTPRGKVIWTEQSLAPVPPKPSPASAPVATGCRRGR
ncbi:SpoIIE family protein phosphatase [Streptomyces sp. NPDC058735]|uniref:SpoIIE family protein phosphatase n=1 Tax=unclassified Streptomyces TaxID=2593676 RepID=UPI0036B48BB3